MTWLDVHLYDVLAGAAFLVSLVCLVIVCWPTPQPVSQWPLRHFNQQPVIRRPKDAA